MMRMRIPSIMNIGSITRSIAMHVVGSIVIHK